MDREQGTGTAVCALPSPSLGVCPGVEPALETSLSLPHSGRQLLAVLQDKLLHKASNNIKSRRRSGSPVLPSCTLKVGEATPQLFVLPAATRTQCGCSGCLSAHLALFIWPPRPSTLVPGTPGASHPCSPGGQPAVPPQTWPATRELFKLQEKYGPIYSFRLGSKTTGID